MYRITVSASRLTAYSSESGSSSDTRQTPWRLSQNAVQHRCSARNAAIWAAAYGVGRLVALSLIHDSPPGPPSPLYGSPIPPG